MVGRRGQGEACLGVDPEGSSALCCLTFRLWIPAQSGPASMQMVTDVISKAGFVRDLSMFAY